MRVSACIVARNEAKLLPGLLCTLNGRVDEIVVVDGGSDDGTQDIAAGFTDSVYTGDSGHPDGDRHIYVENAKNDWLLVVDADERFSINFMDWLGVAPYSHISGYWLARRNYYTPNKYYRHIIYPDYQLRLFDRRKLVTINDRIHSRPVVSGEMFTLPEDCYIRHFDPIFSDHKKYRKYAQLQALEHRGTPSTLKAYSQFMVWMGFAIKNGCLSDGFAGINMAYSQALYHYWLCKYGYTMPEHIEGEAGEVRDNLASI